MDKMRGIISSLGRKDPHFAFGFQLGTIPKKKTCMVSDSVIKEDLNIYYLGGLLHNWNLINFNLECLAQTRLKYVYYLG